VCEELQLLTVSVFPLSGEFFTNNHSTHTTPSKCKLSFPLTIVQGRCFCQSLLPKCVLNIQFAANILFRDEARFTMDCIVSFHNAHIWVDDNSHTTGASRHQHWFFINVCVGILCNNPLGPVISANRLTSAVYCRFVVDDFQYSWNMCLFTNGNTCGSCMLRHHLIF
jgi:hypothetical protein